MMAVVKNIPKAYFRANAWFSLSLKACLYPLTKKWMMLPMMNLLKRTTPKIAE